jgi:glycine C-acetyltransferase
MSKLFELLGTEANHLRQAGLLRPESILSSPQGPTIAIGTRELLNLASNDYLGLAVHPEVKKAAIGAIEKWGVGTASTRAGTGTVTLHDELERALAQHLGTEEAMVLASGYHANTGLLESLLSDRDYVFCDEQMRPGLADGVRLCRARAYSYRHQEMEHLEDRLRRSRGARFRVILTDGVFPMSGQIAHLTEIHALADKYGALVAVDDTHGVGVLGASGRGTHQHLELGGRSHLVTGSFGAALGGGAGGFIAGKREIIVWLRQKSRPYLVSTALDPASTAAAKRALEIIQTDPEPQKLLTANTRLFRRRLSERGFEGMDGVHPAVAVPIRDAVVAQRLTDLLYKRGVYAIGFCHPIVPEGAARIRAQITARHSEKALESAVEAFVDSAMELKLSLDPKTPIRA